MQSLRVNTSLMAYNQINPFFITAVVLTRELVLCNGSLTGLGILVPS